MVLEVLISYCKLNRDQYARVAVTDAKCKWCEIDEDKIYAMLWH